MSINVRLSRAISSPHKSRTYLNFYDPINDDSSPQEPHASVPKESDLFRLPEVVNRKNSESSKEVA